MLLGGFFLFFDFLLFVLNATFPGFAEDVEQETHCQDDAAGAIAGEVSRIQDHHRETAGDTNYNSDDG